MNIIICCFFFLFYLFRFVFFFVNVVAGFTYLLVCLAVWLLHPLFVFVFSLFLPCMAFYFRG